MELYDLCVIGAGMFGSAAARHASANPTIRVCLVGPAEPTADEFSEREIFGAHYDEGRITRVLDGEPACQTLSQHSIARYRELERLSGIQFYEPVGCLFTGPKNGSFIRGVLSSGAAGRVPLVQMPGDGGTLRSRYSYLQLRADEVALLDDTGGGHISPRGMVAAQKKVARLQGCHIVEGVVCATQTQEDGINVVRTESGQKVRAKRLLIATGGFVNFKNLEVLKPLSVKCYKDTVILLQLPEDEVQRLRSMPSLISLRDTSQGQVGAYILPPIKYPDGQYYLKFGNSHNQDEGDVLRTLEEMRQWYLSEGNKKMEETHLKFVSRLIPGLKFSGLRKHTCAFCVTPSGLPYIDRVSPTVTVAVGGNGKGAKLSDEVGRLAAHLALTGRWDSSLEQGLFEADFQRDDSL